MSIMGNIDIFNQVKACTRTCCECGTTIYPQIVGLDEENKQLILDISNAIILENGSVCHKCMYTIQKKVYQQWYNQMD